MQWRFEQRFEATGMTSDVCWMVRAGQGGTIFGEFKEQSIVTIGGFAREAYYEAERANIPCTFMNIVDHYENMDIATQRLIPLRRVYWSA